MDTNRNRGRASSYAYYYTDADGNTRAAHGYIDANGNVYRYTHPAADRDAGANHPRAARNDGYPASAVHRANVLRQPDRQR